MNCITHASKLTGSITVPGSKSHTIRACLFGALGEGRSYIKNPLVSEDCLSALRCIQELGAVVYQSQDNSVWEIEGAGKRIHLPENVIDVGNSGSVMYFLTPIAASFPAGRSSPVMHLSETGL